MLSLAMIRVEPGSTPGIGITISEYFFFVFCAMFFAFRKGNWSHVILQTSSGVENLCDTYCYYIPYLQILGFGDYILLHQVRQSR